eukprot:1686992-Amphidinium_carterae.1
MTALSSEQRPFLDVSNGPSTESTQQQPEDDKYATGISSSHLEDVKPTSFSTPFTSAKPTM